MQRYHPFNYNTMNYAPDDKYTHLQNGPKNKIAKTKYLEILSRGVQFAVIYLDKSYKIWNKVKLR